MAMMNTSSLDTAETSSVLTFLQGLQQRITDAVQAMEPQSTLRGGRLAQG